MSHRTGQNRQQFGLFATPLDEMIAPDNMVRVIDAFVDAIDLDPEASGALSTSRRTKEALRRITPDCCSKFISYAPGDNNFGRFRPDRAG